MRRVLLPILVCASAVHARPALADGQAYGDPYSIPSAPRPPTLPELTHSEIEATLETTAGAILPNEGGQQAHAYVQRFGVEVPLSRRRWFVGAAYDVAGGNVDSSFKAVSGNVEIDGRTLWATRTGLAFGGGTSVMLPAADYDANGPAGRVALGAASLRPWDVAFFVPDAFGLRPFVDVRALDGPFVAQFRQGLDLMFSTALLGERRLYATTGVYLGWRFSPAVAGGLEAFEAYAIDVPAVRDGARASIIASPNVRLTLPWIQPAVSVFTNVGTPFQGASDRVLGFRVAITVVGRTPDPER